MPHPLTSYIREELKKQANPEKALAMARYMKNRQEFLGVQSARVRALSGQAARRYTLEDYPAFERVMRELWNGKWREERYCAIRLAERLKKFRVPEALDLYQWMIVTGEWWDLVDGIASNLVGKLIQDFPALKPRVFGLIDSENIWLRRTALLSQLNFKEETDPEILSGMITKTAHETEFFIRKAIGWILRQYARTDPQFVRDFVKNHQSELSGLSRREAMKHL